MYPPLQVKVSSTAQPIPLQLGAENVAVTDRSVDMVTTHVEDDPEQAPLQPANV